MDQEFYAAFAARAGGNCAIAVVGGAGVGKSTLLNAFASSSGAMRTEGGAELRLPGGTFSLQEGEQGDAALLVCTDGSFVPREGTLAAEEAAAARLAQGGKPFAVVLNSAAPDSADCKALCIALREKYGVPVCGCDCTRADGVEEWLQMLLFSFPAVALEIELPDWMCVLPEDSPALQPILAKVREIAPNVRALSDCALFQQAFAADDVYCEGYETDPSDGTATFRFAAKDGVFYRMLSRECGESIEDDLHLMSYVASLKDAKRMYDKFRNALAAAEANGYGVVGPAEDDMQLCAPELFRRGGKCGVRLKAEAPSYHIMKIDVHSEITPVTGDAARSEEIAKGMVESYEQDAQQLWNTDMFGRTFKEMAEDGLREKLSNMPDEARSKLRRAVGRIVNEGKGGVICILL